MNYTIRISTEELKKLDRVVEFHGSDRAKILRRGIQLIEKYDLKINNLNDDNLKNQIIGIRLSEQENLILKKYNTNLNQVYGFLIDIQFKSIEELEKTEKRLLISS